MRVLVVNNDTFATLVEITESLPEISREIVQTCHYQGNAGEVIVVRTDVPIRIEIGNLAFLPATGPSK